MPDNERTPLLQHQDSDSLSKHSKTSNDRSSASSIATISDLGDFTLQPAQLAKAISNKDANALLDELDKSSAKGDIYSAFQTDPKSGLSTDQTDADGAEERIRVYGRNQLPEKELKSFWRFLWEAFSDKVLIILTGGSATAASK